MKTTLRQFLKDLFNRFVERAQDFNLDIEFNVSESLLTGSFSMASSAAPYTLVTSSDAADIGEVKDVRVFVLVASSDPAEILEIAMIEGTPSILLPLTTIDFNDPATYDHLFQSLTQRHPFVAARHLKLFSQQTKPE